MEEVKLSLFADEIIYADNTKEIYKTATNK